MTDTFRRTYTELSDEQKEQMDYIKQTAETLEHILDTYVPRDERSERSRCMALARTNLETAVMYAVKAVTTKQE